MFHALEPLNDKNNPIHQYEKMEVCFKMKYIKFSLTELVLRKYCTSRSSL